ncbi:hypothetical protein Tco_0707416 [Tanacetum coccineum]|uniref:Uncharacterized protein n=1 Tax=Tanacetum coccineum TaxID=301880 RepID=A0ABQ4YC97_9ASTR
MRVTWTRDLWIFDYLWEVVFWSFEDVSCDDSGAEPGEASGLGSVCQEMRQNKETNRRLGGPFRGGEEIGGAKGPGWGRPIMPLPGGSSKRGPGEGSGKGAGGGAGRGGRGEAIQNWVAEDWYWRRIGEKGWDCGKGAGVGKGGGAGGGLVSEKRGGAAGNEGLWESYDCLDGRKGAEWGWVYFDLGGVVPDRNGRDPTNIEGYRVYIVLKDESELVGDGVEGLGRDRYGSVAGGDAGVIGMSGAVGGACCRDFGSCGDSGLGLKYVQVVFIGGAHCYYGLYLGWEMLLQKYILNDFMSLLTHASRAKFLWGIAFATGRKRFTDPKTKLRMKHTKQGNMNGWLIEDEDEPLEHEASGKGVDSDLESTASSKPMLKKTTKADPDYASRNCPYCSK